MFGCLDQKYSINLSGELEEEKIANISSTRRLYKTGLKLIGQSPNQLLSKLQIKMLAKTGSNGDDIAILSNCL